MKGETDSEEGYRQKKGKDAESYGEDHSNRKSRRAGDVHSGQVRGWRWPQDLREAPPCSGEQLGYDDGLRRCQETSVSGRLLHLSHRRLGKAGPGPKQE